MTAEAEAKDQIREADSHGRRCRFVSDPGAAVLELPAPGRRFAAGRPAR